MPKRYFQLLLSNLDQNARRQLSWDIVTGLGHGLIGSHIMYVFGILVANEVFQCSSGEKTLIVGGLFIGMGCTIFYEAVAHRLFKTRNAQAAIPAALSVIGALVVGFADSSTLFVLGCVVMGMAQTLSLPAMTSIWRENYPTRLRGQATSVALWTKSLSAIGCSALGGYWLDISIENYRSLFLIFGGVSLCVSFSILKMPTVKLPPHEHRPPTNPLKTLKANPIFTQILIAWFLIGLAMHLVFVQKTEYLSNPDYGLELSIFEVAIYASALSELAKLLSMPIFARAFDKMDFFNLRILINVIFMFFIAIYFNTQMLSLIALASILHGIGSGGGVPLWNLWVTKFAKAEETGSFMAIHTFLTGLRGVLGPWLSYQLIAVSSIQVTSWCALTLQFIAIILFLRIKARYSKQARGENSVKSTA